jgi:hypothetical protein
VQGVARAEARRFGPAVQRVAGDRKAEVREMHADLMTKRALYRELDEREALIASKHAIACAGELGVALRRLVLEDAYAARIRAVRAEQCLDLARCGQAAAGNGQVALLDQGGLEQGASRLEAA